MRCMAQSFDETVHLLARIDSSVHFLQQEAAMGLMIVVMYKEAVTIALADFCDWDFFRVVEVSVEVPFFVFQELFFRDRIVAFWCDP